MRFRRTDLENLDSRPPDVAAAAVEVKAAKRKFVCCFLLPLPPSPPPPFFLSAELGKKVSGAFFAVHTPLKFTFCCERQLERVRVCERWDLHV